MKFQLRDLWRWAGTVGRGSYLCIGVIGFAIKHNVDRLIASCFYRRPWKLFNYWIPPSDIVNVSALSSDDVRFLATMVVCALPFIWVGVGLTLRRLRAIGWPLWLAILFFAPFLNLLFFLLLSLIPSCAVTSPETRGIPRPVQRWLDHVIPHGWWGSAALAVALTASLGAVGAYFSVEALVAYGWGLFVGGPFVLGLMAVLLYGYHAARSLGGCLVVAMLAIGLVSGLLFALAVEGIFCLAMAVPIAMALGLFGALVGYAIQRNVRRGTATPVVLLVVSLVTPGMMGLEQAVAPRPPLLTVRTAIEIDATPETVWKNVVAFAEIPPPTEWIFRHGIAYPIRAELSGEGVGAKRRCVFSTGAFVEPIEMWDAPQLLRFGVEAQPPPMVEWSPYPGIQPAHLDGYMQSRRGQFLLTALPDGRTRLEGTTWYTNAMWPTAYWQLWSDWILHRIHFRVLQHIKGEAEGRT